MSAAPTAVSGKVILRNSAILTAYYTLESGVLFLLTILFARYLGVADFGRLTFALAYALLFVIADPSVNLVLTKYVARDPTAAQRWVDEGVTFRLMMCVSMLALALLPFSFSSYLRMNALLFVPIIISEQIRGIALTYCMVFRGFQRMGFEPFVLGLERIPELAACYVVLHNGWRIEWLGVVFLGARFLSMAASVLIFNVYFGRMRLRRPTIGRELLREAFPVAVLTGSERVNMSLMPILLTFISGEAAGGLFQSSFKIVMLPIMACGVLGGSLFPAMSSCFADRVKMQKLYRFGVRVLWHVLLPFAVVACVLAPQTLTALYGARYQSAAPILQLLTPYYLFGSIVMVSYYVLIAINQQKEVMRLAMIGTAITLVLGGPLMYWWGAIGAAVALALSYCFVALGYLRLASKLGLALLSKPADILPWLSAGITGGLLWWAAPHLPTHNLLQLAGVSVLVVVVYAAILALIGGVTTEERSLLAQKLGSRWPGLRPAPVMVDRNS